MNFHDLLVNAGYFFLAINTIVFMISYTNKDKALKYFIMYLILCSIIQLYSHHLSNLNKHNLFLSHYFFIGQFIFLSLFFATFYKLKKYKNLNWFLIVVITIPFAIYLYTNPKAYERWSELEIAITSIPLIINSFYFFIKKIDYNTNKKYIYFNSGFFLYTLCSTLIFTVGNIGSREIKSYVWLINSILYFVFQVAIFAEWYLNFRKTLRFKKTRKLKH